MSKLDLKPCPFCGGEPKYMETELDSHWIECEDCQGRSTNYGDSCYEHAVETWNHRPIEEQLKQRIEELEEEIGTLNDTLLNINEEYQKALRTCRDAIKVNCRVECRPKDECPDDCEFNKALEQAKPLLPDKEKE